MALTHAPPSANISQRRAIGVLALAITSLTALAILLALVFGRLGSPSHTKSLAGTWQRLGRDGSYSPIAVPFRAKRLGLPVDQPIRLTRAVAIPTTLTSPALLIEGLQYQVQVTWDGTVIATTGDLPGPARLPRSSRLRVTIPRELAATGAHQLGLTILGDHGSAGIWGPVRMGQDYELERYATGRGSQRIALSAALSIAALLGLVISAMRPNQQAFLWFGLFCASACATAITTDDVFWLVSSRIDLRLRFHAASYALMPGTGLLFVDYLVSPRHRKWSVLVVKAGLGLAIFSLFWRDTAVLSVVGLFTDIVASVAVIIGLAIALRTSLAGRHDISPLVVSTSFLVIGAATQRVANEFGYFDLPVLLPTFMLFLGTTAAGLVIGRSDLADRYRQLVANAQDAILVILPDGRIEEGNAVAYHILGRDPVGLDATSMVQPHSQEALDRHLHDSSEKARRVELRLRSNTARSTTVESVASNLPRGRILLVMRDITARLKAEEGMLTAARMETVGIIAGGIAHDFNNAMTALMAHIGLLSMKLSEDKDRDRLRRMEAVIHRAAQMTRRLLTLARGGNKIRTEIDLGVPAHGAVELTRSMLPSVVTIKERIEPELPQVLGSADELEQAVLNLLLNARDVLAEDGGTIRLRLRRHREHGLPAGVRLDVEDDGPGVPEAIMDSIWEPFFTTKREGQGTGLGLCVVARVVREHGGQLRLSYVHPAAADGRRGCRFTILLPTIEKAKTQVVDAGRRDQIVLVVDDEDDIREMVRAELRSRGYRVWVANSADQALIVLGQHDTPPDVLVTDVVMPGRDGISLANELCERLPQLRVLVMSGFIPQRAAALAPDWQFLSKPFSAEQLATSLRRAILTESTALGGFDPPTEEI